MKKQDIWTLLADENESRIPLAEELLRTSYDELLEIDLREDRYRYIHHVNDKYRGAGPEGNFTSLIALNVEHFVHPEDAEAYAAFYHWDTMAQRLKNAPIPGALAESFRIKATDGTWIQTRQLLVDGGELGLSQEIVRCFIFDVQLQRRRLLPGDHENSRPKTRLRLEEVTGLPEGVDFFRPIQDRLEELSEGWCVVDVDIDHYKLFSEWYGMDSGRRLLIRVADALRARAEAMGGMPGYLGQDQFCLVIPYDMERIRSIYDELQEIISSVSVIDGFSPIFGIALIDGSSTQITEYYNHAALTAEEGRDNQSKRISLYDAQLHRRNSQEYRLLYEFRTAIKNREITFWLQPQYRVSTRKIVGAEALSRWRRSDGTDISPGVFVPLLEKYNLVSQLDVFIWESVAQWIRDWIDRGHVPVPISVNISQIDLFALDVPAFFQGLLEKYDLTTSSFKLELTESAYVDDTGSVRRAVSRLRDMGFMVLMDDFGSGYSSLNMLRNIEVDVIKLDAQFLRIDEGETQKGINILESVVNMTRNLATPIIVEGVETLDQVSFLSDMGCRYMQGFFFNKAMPVKEFEALIRDENAIDTRGIVFKANQQLQIREFLDENIYSDVMLNNILGPVAFYYWHGEDVDIIRYNEQFYQLVGIEPDVLEERRYHSQNYLHKGDKEKLYGLLKYAEDHHAIGAKGVIRAIRPNGVMIWLSLQIYYIGLDGQGKKFYVSAEDVTEFQFVDSELPSAYYRCSLEEEYTFLFISQNFMKLTGFSQTEIQLLFNNKLLNMVHPNDRKSLMEQADAIALGETVQPKPYRLQRKAGDYIYVTEQSHISDHYGALCWQAVAIEVNDVMRIRNQMRILSNHLSATILFLRRIGQELEYEVAIHGLAGQMGMDAKTFRHMLNGGAICPMIEGYESIPHKKYTEQFIRSAVEAPKEIRVHLPDGTLLPLLVRADRVVDDMTSIEYIVIIQLLE